MIDKNVEKIYELVVQTVKCPTCKANPTKLCWEKSGKKRKTPHTKRIEVFYNDYSMLSFQ